ncbi:NAD(P)H-dependent oxidoreductase [Sphingobium sp.]|uniref:NADPH-dependent FMN reductase n=1 Tax=Sphingobium sp. TaxID=1912891 RepID=UPI0028BEBE9A|nr:NAD(P)H-dependent oxidoreductase [Sphingobium sp.]
MKIVGMGGTTRAGSSSERSIEAVLGEAAALSAQTRMFGGTALASLPHYAPEKQERSNAHREFLEALRAADAIVMESPRYRGGISGLVKNGINLLENTRDDPRACFENMPIGLIVSAAGWKAGGVTRVALRGVVHAMRGWLTPLGISVKPVVPRLFDVDGLIDAGTDNAVALQARRPMNFGAYRTERGVA